MTSESKSMTEFRVEQRKWQRVLPGFSIYEARARKELNRLNWLIELNEFMRETRQRDLRESSSGTEMAFALIRSTCDVEAVAGLRRVEED